MPKIIDRDERRDTLARAALRVIRRDGVDGATIRTIAAEAGWSRGVIEHYFDGRDELLAFCYRHALASAFPALDELRSIPDPLDRLTAIVLAWLPSDEAGRLDNQLWLDFVGRLRGNSRLRATLAEVNDTWIADVRREFSAVAADPRYELTVPSSTAAEMTSLLVDGMLIAVAVYPDRADRAEQEATLRRFFASIVRTV